MEITGTGVVAEVVVLTARRVQGLEALEGELLVPYTTQQSFVQNLVYQL
jgi:hypothetical protein